MKIEPRKAIKIVIFLISTFIADKCVGFNIISTPNHPITNEKNRFLDIFSFIKKLANIDIKIGYVY